MYGITRQSQGIVERELSKFYYQSYFTCKDGVSYSVHDVEKSWIEEVENDGQN
jgi:hypothetical protein